MSGMIESYDQMHVSRLLECQHYLIGHTRVFILSITLHAVMKNTYILVMTGLLAVASEFHILHQPEQVCCA